MDNVIIRPVRKSDIEFIYMLCMSERWNYSRKSIERLSAYRQSEFFIAEQNGKRIGHVFSISYGEVGWIGLLLVDKEHRRSGVGTLLMRRAMSYLLDSGVKMIRLEAATEVADLYRKLGFTDAFDSLEFMRVNRRDVGISSLKVAKMRRDEIVEIADFDSIYFGAHRTQVLLGLYEDNQELCFTSRLDNQIVGYIMCHEAEIGYRIGPWICNPDYPSIARELLSFCMESIEADAELCIMIPGANEAAIKLVQDLKFSLSLKAVSMRYGKKLEKGLVEGIFSIGGPEKG